MQNVNIVVFEIPRPEWIENRETNSKFSVQDSAKFQYLGLKYDLKKEVKTDCGEFLSARIRNSETTTDHEAFPNFSKEGFGTAAGGTVKSARCAHWGTGRQTVNNTENDGLLLNRTSFGL